MVCKPRSRSHHCGTAERFFEKNNLEVNIIEPADPALPPKLAAAGKVDLAVSYQPQLYQQVAEGLPLVRVGSLISNPLNSVVVLKRAI